MLEATITLCSATNLASESIAGDLALIASRFLQALYQKRLMSKW